jgi:hypothetical protein
MFEEELNELRFLGCRWVVDIVGDEDGAKARDGQRPRVEVPLQVVDVL